MVLPSPNRIISSTLLVFSNDSRDFGAPFQSGNGWIAHRCVGESEDKSGGFLHINQPVKEPVIDLSDTEGAFLL
jgi:hypothetical protein